MKKIFSLIALALVALTINAKELVSNPLTNAALDENLGVYSIRTNSGAIILGDKDAARTFLLNADACFAKKALSSTFEVGDGKYEVKKDDEGIYILKVGFGLVKVRPTDANLFLTTIQGKVIGDKAKNLWKDITK